MEIGLLSATVYELEEEESTPELKKQITSLVRRIHLLDDRSKGIRRD